MNAKNKKEQSMSETDMSDSSDVNAALRTILEDAGFGWAGDVSSESGSSAVLHSALSALSEGRVSELVELFADTFSFNDHALALEFTDKQRLTEFLEKSRELFPDSTVEIVSLFQSGGRAVAEGNLAATQTVPYGSITCRYPVSSHGSTIVQVENEKIVRWSDYYDQNSSRRANLAGLFTEWIEY
jgi:steroid delta-isomerase-like uncharacterized protein